MGEGGGEGGGEEGQEVSVAGGGGDVDGSLGREEGRGGGRGGGGVIRAHETGFRRGAQHLSVFVLEEGVGVVPEGAGGLYSLSMEELGGGSGGSGGGGGGALQEEQDNALVAAGCSLKRVSVMP
jgi:hypothetical protein